MKKKSLFLFLLVGMVGLFIPKDAFAIEFRVAVVRDYRFFVEDQDEKDVDSLHFKLHDVNNLVSYDSEYDPNTKAYYFLSNNVYEEIQNGEKLIPGDLLADLKNIYSSNIQFYDALGSVASKYPSVDFNQGFIQFYIPFVLEEVDHQGEGVPIKKTTLALAQVYPGMVQILLVNNSCIYSNQDNVPDELIYMIKDILTFTRKSAMDYDEALMERYLSLQMASNEIHNDNYLNKGFLNDKFATSEIASGEKENISVASSNELPFMNFDVDGARSSSDNLKEELLKDYCDCLPVFVQARKTSITNPKTWNSGIIAMGVSLLLVIGTGSYILYNQNKRG